MNATWTWTCFASFGPGLKCRDSINYPIYCWVDLFGESKYGNTINHQFLIVKFQFKLKDKIFGYSTISYQNCILQFKKEINTISGLYCRVHAARNFTWVALNNVRFTCYDYCIVLFRQEITEYPFIEYTIGGPHCRIKWYGVHLLCLSLFKLHSAI